MGKFVFFWQRETGAERVAMATMLTVKFCFFYDAHLWCQLSRTLLQYFQRYFSFSILPFFSCKSHDVIGDQCAYYKNVNISETKKGISKRKMPFFCISKRLSNKQKIFFMSYTLQTLYVRAYLYSAFFVANKRFPFAFSNNS